MLRGLTYFVVICNKKKSVYHFVLKKETKLDEFTVKVENMTMFKEFGSFVAIESYTY